MENRIQINQVETGVYKTCQCCGRHLPITQYYRIGRGYRRFCKDCFRAQTGRSDKFADVGDNALLLELQNRGYHGILHIEVVKSKTI